MAIKPTTELYIGTVPWNSNYTGVQSYDSRTVQISEIKKLCTHAFISVNIIRRDTPFVLQGVNQDLTQCNYLMYRNNDISTKWYFSFINKVDYNSKNSVKIFSILDVWQTYQFDIKYFKSLIIRAHIPKSADTIGRWLAPEPIGVNAEIVKPLEADISLNWSPSWVLHATSWLENKDGKKIYNYDGLSDGDFVTSEIGLNVTDSQDLKKYIEGYGKLSPADALKTNNDDEYSNWIADLLTGETINKAVNLIATTSIAQLQDHRSELVGLYAVPQWVKGDITGKFVSVANKTEFLNYNYSKTELPCGYAPRNKKMLTSLCRAFCVYTKNGFKKIFRPELMPTIAKFRLLGNAMATDGVIFQLIDYKDDSEKTFKVPYACQTRFGYDQNTGLDKVINGVQSAIGLIGNAASISTGNPVGLLYGSSNLIGSASSIVDSIGQRGISNGTTGDILSITEDNAIPYFADISVTANEAKYIDDYLDIYGYSINEIDKISDYMNTRSNWNYIKTANCNIKLNAPNEDIEKIVSIFEQGVTIWHKDFGNYEAENN